MYRFVHKIILRQFAKARRKQVLFPSKAPIDTRESNIKTERVLESANFESFIKSYKINPYDNVLNDYRQLNFELANAKLKKTTKKNLQAKMQHLKASLDISKARDLIKLPLLFRPEEAIANESSISDSMIYPVVEEDIKAIAAAKLTQLFADINSLSQTNLGNYCEKSFTSLLKANLNLLNAVGCKLEYKLQPVDQASISIKGFSSYLLIDCSPNRKKNGIKYNYSEKTIEHNGADVLSIKRRHLRKDVEAHLIDQIHMEAAFSGILRLKKNDETVFEEEMVSKIQSVKAEIVWNSFDYRKFKRNAGKSTSLSSYGDTRSIEDMSIIDFSSIMRGNSFYKYVDLN